MKKVYLTSWEAGLSRVLFLKDIAHNDICDIREARDIIERLIEGEEPAFAVNDNKLESLLQMLNKFKIGYKLEIKN